MKTLLQGLGKLRDAYRGLPIPPVPRAVLSVVILLQLIVVVLNVDVFPFLSVSMHSTPRRNVTADGEWRLRSFGLLSEDRRQVQLISINREAMPWRQLDLSLDWREARVWFIGSRRSADVRQQFAQLLRDNGLDPVLLSVELSMKNGKIHAVEPM